MSDLLDDLVAATKDSPVLHDEADETRRRVLAEHKPTLSAAPAARRRRWSPWVLPLVAAFVATGALAAGPIGRRALAVLSPSTSPTSAPSVTAATATSPFARSTPGPTAPTVADEPATPTPEPMPVPEPPAPRAVEAAPTTGTTNPTEATASPVPPSAPRAPAASPALAGHEAPRPSTSPAATAVVKPLDETRASDGADAGAAPARVATEPVAPAGAAPATDEADALYRAAHDRHFRGGNPAEAIAAWDAYLAKAPRGRFVPEARYNRALQLLRAGRRSEGLAALEPFARGAFGGYRQADAQKLLEAAAP
jgi:hypothetical protein